MNLHEMPLGQQFAFLLLLALPVSCASWTVTHEEVFREPREFCRERSQGCRSLPARKFFYLFTCEYCFSHYVAALTLLLTRFHMLYPGWRGYLVAWLSLVWIGNIYMSLFNRLRLDIKHENVDIAIDQEVQNKVESIQPPTGSIPPENGGALAANSSRVRSIQTS